MSPSIESWAPSNTDVMWLTEQLRASHLVVLCGDDGSVISELLKQGVLPRLQRRAEDRAVLAGLRSAHRPQLRERRQQQTSPESEVSVFFDQWGASPRQALLGCVQEALENETGIDEDGPPAQLADRLVVLSKRFGVRFLFMFDRFEECLAAAPQNDELRALSEEIFHAVNRPGLPAQFMIALREDQQPLLEELHGRVAVFEARRRQFPHVQARVYGSSAPTLHPLQCAAQPRSRLASTGAVYDSIETWLNEIAQRRPEPELEPKYGAGTPLSPGAATLAAPADAVATAEPPLGRGFPQLDEPAEGVAADPIGRMIAGDSPTAAAVSATTLGAATTPNAAGPGIQHDFQRLLGPPARTQRNAAPSPRLALAALTLVAVGVSLWLALAPAALSPSFPLAMAPTAAGPEPTVANFSPPPSTAVQALARLEITTSGGTAERLAEEWALALQADGTAGLVARPSRGWAEDLASLHGGGGLVMARYDALRAARSQPEAGALRVLMPMFIDELSFVVRADSALQFIHEIRGRRIDAGDANSARALTVRSAYEGLFGSPLSELAGAGTADDTAALQALLESRADVAVIVGRPTERSLTALTPGAVGALRVLRLDRQHPSSRRAMRSLLSASLATGLDGRPMDQPTPTLAVMSFLVTGPGRGSDGSTYGDAQLARIASDLCRHLPALQRAGDPKWRELQPGLQLDAGWPYVSEVQSALRDCPAPGRGPQVPPVLSTPATPAGPKLPPTSPTGVSS